MSRLEVLKAKDGPARIVLNGAVLLPKKFIINRKAMNAARKRYQDFILYMKGVQALQGSNTISREVLLEHYGEWSPTVAYYYYYSMPRERAENLYGEELDAVLDIAASGTDKEWYHLMLWLAATEKKSCDTVRPSAKAEIPG